MSSYPDAEVINLIKDLVFKLTNFKVGSNLFDHVEKYVVNCVHNADSMVFLKKRDIDIAITSLSDKFIFHGFALQASDLIKHYHNFLPSTTPKNEHESKLNIIKFLLCLSDSPTAKFLENPIGYSRTDDLEEIDWPAYLQEGIQRWSPPLTESSDTWTDDSKSDKSRSPSPTIQPKSVKIIQEDEVETVEPKLLSYNYWRNTLLDSIQYGWFNKERVYMKPESTNVDANIAIYWDDFIEYSVKGLIPLNRTNIISEYCVLREIIWQCCTMHNSFTYHFVGNQLLPKEGVSIASVRPIAFNIFLHEFLPYLELLQEFRDFHESLYNNNFQQAPDTYRSYNESLRNFIKPVFNEVVKLEKEILTQKTTMTLLKLANKFKILFHNMQILKQIHNNTILDFTNNDALTCAITLLSRLHIGLLHCISKTELDIYLTLYLESLFKYFHIIDTWLENDTLIDVHREFIIKQIYNVPNITTDITDFNFMNITDERIADYDNFDGTMGFIVNELDDVCTNDSIFEIILTDVLQIGKNIHFLRLLKKLYLLDDTLTPESLHKELINRVLKEIRSYFQYEEEKQEENAIALNDEEPSYIFPAICPDYCRYPTEMDKLENLIDTSDGFLMNAFQTFFTEQVKEESLEVEETLYEKISKITSSIYPAKQIIDNVFSQILRERYSESGYLVKNLLIVDFQMRKHFELLAHLFLFKDDMIFPVYRRLFVQMVDCKRFDNDVWLTTQLHDIMIDPYPDFYEKCIVNIDNASQFIEDPLKGCEMVDVNYLIEWPVNLIIRESHLEKYSELFHLCLKIKWALYTLNHLYFHEIESGNTKIQQPKALTLFLRKLKVFRFHLLNEFSTIQHYILGYVFSKYLKKFENDFEQAYNLDTLIDSHSNFINSVYTTSTYFRDLNDKTHGFNLLLYIVRKFHMMWKNVRSVTEEELHKYELMFIKCRDSLNPVIFPRDIIIEV